jgi:hypothetical protein
MPCRCGVGSGITPPAFTLDTNVHLLGGEPNEALDLDSKLTEGVRRVPTEGGVTAPRQPESVPLEIAQ